MNASKTQSWLVLAGKPGTGKTHLAVAIALCAMKQGRQAIFWRVSRMLDERYVNNLQTIATTNTKTPEECVIFEDSSSGIEAAKRSGCTYFAVNIEP